MKKKIYLLVYACDYDAHDPNKCGPETILRLKRAIRFIKEHPSWDIVVLLTAGTRVKRNPVPLKEVMKCYLAQAFTEEALADAAFVIPTIVTATKNWWSTFEETV